MFLKKFPENLKTLFFLLPAERKKNIMAPPLDSSDKILVRAVIRNLIQATLVGLFVIIFSQNIASSWDSAGWRLSALILGFVLSVAYIMTVVRSVSAAPVALCSVLVVTVCGIFTVVGMLASGEYKRND